MTEAERPTTVVVGYDGSDAARRALDRVRRLSTAGITVILIAVRRDVRSAGLGERLAGRDTDPVALLREASELLDGGSGATIDARTAVGDPAVVLLGAARESGADLLVVGRTGRDFVARTLLGSVATRVVEQAPCDVLVVH